MNVSAAVGGWTSNPSMAGSSETLGRFLEDLHDGYCQFTVPQEVVSAVQQAVEKMVKLLTDEVSRLTIYPVFKVSKIYPRGSFYEGTKVGLPDEFDFLVELDFMTRPGIVDFLSECPQCPGCVHVKIVDKELKKINENLDKEAADSSYLRPSLVSRDYGYCLADACPVVFPGAKTTGWSDKAQIHTGNGFLALLETLYTGVHSPNTLLTLRWTTKTSNPAQQQTTTTTTKTRPMDQDDDLMKEFVVTVDVTPAILYHSADDTTIRHVIPARNNNCQWGSAVKSRCWRISHSSQELYQMKNQSDNHQKVYKILKYVCQKRSHPLKSLSSYMIKTALLHHTDSCDNAGSIGICFTKILSELLTYAQRGRLPGYFTPEKNVWVTTPESTVIIPKPILRKLIILFDCVAYSSPREYQFKKFYQDLYLLREVFQWLDGDLISRRFT